MIVTMLTTGKALPPHVEKQMIRQALLTDDEEICGLIVEFEYSAGTVTSPVLCRNISSAPATSYEMHPEDQQRAYELPGGKVVGLYHSHPSGNPAPSKTDYKFWPPDPDLRYFIVVSTGENIGVYEYVAKEDQ